MLFNLTTPEHCMRMIMSLVPSNSQLLLIVGESLSEPHTGGSNVKNELGLCVSVCMFIVFVRSGFGLNGLF